MFGLFFQMNPDVLKPGVSRMAGLICNSCLLKTLIVQYGKYFNCPRLVEPQPQLNDLESKLDLLECGEPTRIA